MSESKLEQLFSDVVLSLSTPENAFKLPSEVPGPDSWLQELFNTVDRKLAYFDEVLSAFLVMRVKFDPPESDGRPPLELVAFLTFLQVAFEASYISPEQAPSAPSYTLSNAPGQLLGPPPPGRAGAKPRTGSPLKPKPPPLIPPQTPNPTPRMEDSDRQYAIAEGIQLHSFIWGDTTAKDERKDDFAILWDGTTNEWVIVYRMDVTIVYLKTRVPDPLLCLTVSVTLRDKPLAITPARRPIFDMITVDDETKTPTQQNMRPPSPPGFRDLFGDLEEVNLLDGLSSGTTFSNPEGLESLRLPSTRLASFVRRQAYWLPPLKTNSMAALPSSPISARTSRPILRKAFRKTLNTCNGFHVRMRTIFVPYVLIPGAEDDDEERREAGSEERSVVLCVEIENTGESSKDFEVESVNVNVSGEGASSRLISWGKALVESQPETVFPLRLRPMEQYNLLYSVTFLHPIDSNDPLMARTVPSGPTTQSNDMQRSVSIIIRGRPCETIDGNLSYPTDAFNSKWNCLLNLSPHQQTDLGDYQLNEPLSVGDALPTPATPFPVSSPRLQVDFERNHPISSSRSPAIGGSKRHTVSGLSGRRNTIPSPIKVRFSLPAGVTATSTPSTSGPKTAAPMVMSPSSPVPPTPSTAGLYGSVPATPAYPAWSPDAQTVPPTPWQQGPMMGQVGNTVGKLIEPHRDRRMSPSGVLIPPTPGPLAYGTSISERLANMEPYSEPVVVSVSLLTPNQATDNLDRARKTGPRKDWIYPLDIFALEIFVFNQSPVTRRFEVALPDRKRHRRQLLEDKRRSLMQDGTSSSNHRLIGDALSRIGSQAGIIPLENRIRVGPLRPETCQSVRIQFMALRPGLHSVDTLTITDTEAEFTLNLRSVMDVVVRDPF
ncbi:hypothetical protein M408DRAFT_5489 [Serendipita vermifera MAFF 305830]|uniref:Trafficking protein particle complex II-specific subunit 65 IgD3 domain-containing protein n=1 Tax=Serendipita vermifera MAFF 305830 TaxID=933852 RepID=A0A0C3BQ06_SERVB|nr:hypothetical protein M408DRAFT_5489 [Serendipita vermifera MAFF 305830]